MTKTIILLGCSTILLSACGVTKDDFGLGRQTPDEFSVIKRAPLEMPDEYYLPTPTPGISRPQETAPEIAAKEAILGKKISHSASQGSAMERILIEQTGANQAEANIRTRVNRETEQHIKTNIPVAEKLLNSVGADRQAPALVVDAEAEAQRIRNNIDKGLPVSEGDIPTKEQ